MNRRLVNVLALVVALAAMLAFAGVVAAMPNLEFSSNIRVQNIENEPANVVISFYDIDGNGTPVKQLHDTIEGRGDRYYFTVQYDLPEGWSGSAVVGADREIRVVNNLYTEDNMYQASSNGFLEGANEVGLPLIQLSNKDWDTWFNVQNVGPNPADVTVEFLPSTVAGKVAGQYYTTETFTLQPFAAHTLDQRQMTDELLADSPVGSDPDGKAFIGAAIVRSEGAPVVASVVEGSDKRLMMYDGFTDEGTTGILVAPLYDINHNTGISSLHVQNRGTVATDVTVNFVPSNSVPDSGTACYETHTIEPGEMWIFGL